MVVFLITAKRLDRPGWDAGVYNPAVFNPYAIESLFKSQHAQATQNITIPTATITITATVVTTEHSVETITPTPPPLPTSSAAPQDAASSPQASTEAAAAKDPMCAGFPDTSNILLVMKTGATESYDKLPVQIMTVLKCVSDFLLFSDLDQRIGGFHVRDSLETVLAEAKEDNGDFDLYRLQQNCAVDQDNCARILEGADSAGWNLDKYKNIHMAEKAYQLRPHHDWYLFVDADTYVSLPNLVYALGRMDPSEPRYLGVPTVIGDGLFAHGGSGYVVSQAAMKAFVGMHPGIANQYDVETRHHCCGDFLFAVALQETTGIMVEGFVSFFFDCRHCHAPLTKRISIFSGPYPMVKSPSRPSTAQTHGVTPSA